MKIKADRVPKRIRFLTPGKVYEGEYDAPAACQITDDEGDGLILFLPRCSYLDGEAWEIVESSGEEPATAGEALKRWEERCRK